MPFSTFQSVYAFNSAFSGGVNLCLSLILPKKCFRVGQIFCRPTRQSTSWKVDEFGTGQKKYASLNNFGQKKAENGKMGEKVSGASCEPGRRKLLFSKKML